MSTRREFLMTTGALTVTAGAVGAAETVKTIKPLSSVPPAKLNLSAQMGLVPGDSVAEKLANLEKYDFDGLELNAGIVGNVDEYKKAFAGSRIRPSAVCAADGPYQVESTAQQTKAMDNAKRILEAAGEIGCTAVICVPAFNGANGIEGWAGRDLMVKLLHELGEFAVQASCRMVLEPLNRNEAHILRQVGDGAAIARDADSAGIGVMGDFYHMGREETSFMGAFISGGKYLHHVHMASFPRRQQPNADPGDEAMYIDGFRGLKWIGYQEFCSLECGIQGDRAVELPKISKFLRNCWKLA